MKQKTEDFKKLINENTLIENIPEAFAVVREAQKELLIMRHFDVQLLVAKSYMMDKIAEMKTGEGKTLVATLAAYVNAINNKSVHIITVNELLLQKETQSGWVIFTIFLD